MNSSDSVSENDAFETDNDSRDLDYAPSPEDASESSVLQSDADISQPEIDVSVDNRDVPNLENSEFSLQTIHKGHTSSKVWKYFKTLKYKNVVISKVSKLVYCEPCFLNSHLKQ